jgi:hypothetical protein
LSGRVRGARTLWRAPGVPFWVVASLGGAASGSLGCLADPPTFAPRGQIPPFIIAGQVEPPLGSIYEGTTSFGAISSFELNVPFRSEDVNIDLSATLYLDLVPGAPGVPTRAVQRSVRVAASNYEELRLLSMSVDLPSAGCHSLTLIMTYLDNIDPIRGGLPIDEDRAARLVWWLNVGDEEGTTRMADCPGASQVDAVPGGG